jgi:hypothetical protein
MFEIRITSKDINNHVLFDPEELKFEVVQEMFFFICDYFGESDSCTFHVSGFGEEKWVVDVYADMMCLLEQVNTAIDAINRKSNFEIDFYEQGLQRKISFYLESDDNYQLECASGTDWQPLFKEHSSADALSRQLNVFKSKFIEIALSELPQLKENGLFIKWVGNPAR